MDLQIIYLGAAEQTRPELLGHEAHMGVWLHPHRGTGEDDEDFAYDMVREVWFTSHRSSCKGRRARREYHTGVSVDMWCGVNVNTHANWTSLVVRARAREESTVSLAHVPHLRVQCLALVCGGDEIEVAIGGLQLRWRHLLSGWRRLAHAPSVHGALEPDKTAAGRRWALQVSCARL
jgi:hypothetical protein